MTAATDKGVLAVQLARAESAYQHCAGEGDRSGMDWWGCAVYDLRAALARARGEPA